MNKNEKAYHLSDAEKKVRYVVSATGIIPLGIAIVFYVLFKRGLIKANVGFVCFIYGSWVICYVAGIILLASPLLDLFKFLKKGQYRIRHCEIKVFEEIDRYKRHYDNESEARRRVISIINLYYKGHNGVIDHQFVKTKDLDSLYKRMDYLKKDMDIYNKIMSCATSLIMSIVYALLTSGILSIMKENEGLVFLGAVMAFFACMLMIYFIVLQHAYRGQFGSFWYCVDEYEIELLRDKIRDVEENMTLDNNQEYILNTQQCLIEYLMDTRYKEKNRKKRNELEEEIENIQKYHLCDNIPAEAVIKYIVCDRYGLGYYYWDDIEENISLQETDQYKFYAKLEKHKQKLISYLGENNKSMGKTDALL